MVSVRDPSPGAEVDGPFLVAVYIMSMKASWSKIGPGSSE